MPKVRLSRYECERNLLPRVCARCGEPAESGVRLILLTPLLDVAAGALVWFCPLLILFGGAIVRARRSFEVPMCDRDRAAWNRRHRLTVVTFAVLVVGLYLIAVVAVVLVALNEVHPEIERELPLDYLAVGSVMGYLVIGLIWILTILAAWSRRVRAGSYTKEGIQLSGVHPDFIQALGAERMRARETDPARLEWYGDVRDDFDEWNEDGSPRRDDATVQHSE